MHIFIAYWRGIALEFVPRPLPFIFNMPGRFARLLSSFLFNWLVPLVLLAFVWKASGLEDLPLLLLMTALVTTALVWLAIRYRPAEHRQGARYVAFWVALICLVAVSGILLLERSIAHGPTLIAYASDLAETVVAEILPDSGTAERQVASLSDEELSETSKTKPTDAKPVVTKLETKETSQPSAPTQLASVVPRTHVQPQQTTQSLFRGLNLAYANLRKADLMSRNLKGADLRNADLRGVTLRAAKGEFLRNIKFANLTDANLENSSLLRVNFNSSNLTRSNFRNAKLRDIYFYNADLRDADFTGTTFDAVDITFADIRGVKGLDCDRLKQLIVWETAYRDQELACGEPIPNLPAWKKK